MFKFNLSACSTFVYEEMIFDYPQLPQLGQVPRILSY